MKADKGGGRLVPEGFAGTNAEQQSLLANIIVMTAGAIAACVRSVEERGLPGASPEPVDG